RVTYTVGEYSTYYDVTIQESQLPPTGQDMTWVWALCGAALILVAAAGLLASKRKARISE
ncbi:MAG: LPXTG cell wall anchor domain-containing protein, partial [Bacillota bacterium]